MRVWPFDQPDSGFGFHSAPTRSVIPHNHLNAIKIDRARWVNYLLPALVPYASELLSGNTVP
jgi:hypothetical protein